MKRRSRKNSELVGNSSLVATDYDGVLADMVDVLEAARRTSARAVNAVMTAAYWRSGGGLWSLSRGARSGLRYMEKP